VRIGPAGPATQTAVGEAIQRGRRTGSPVSSSSPYRTYLARMHDYLELFAACMYWNAKGRPLPCISDYQNICAAR
jgi:hypothetical protein